MGIIRGSPTQNLGACSLSSTRPTSHGTLTEGSTVFPPVLRPLSRSQMGAQSNNRNRKSLQASLGARRSRTASHRTLMLIMTIRLRHDIHLSTLHSLNRQIEYHQTIQRERSQTKSPPPYLSLHNTLSSCFLLRGLLNSLPFSSELYHRFCTEEGGAIYAFVFS